MNKSDREDKEIQETYWWSHYTHTKIYKIWPHKLLKAVFPGQLMSSPSLASLFPGDHFQHMNRTPPSFRLTWVRWLLAEMLWMTLMDYGVNLYARIEASQKHLMKLSCLYTVPEKTIEIPIDVIHTTIQICPQTVIQIMMLKFLVLTPLKKLRTLTLTAIHWTPLMKVKLIVHKKKNIFCQRICLYGYSGLNFKTLYDNERLLKISLF